MGTGVDLAALRRAADDLQDVVVDPQMWGSRLDGLCRAVGGEFASLMCAPRADRSTMALAGLSEGAEELGRRYLDDGWHHADLRARAMPKLIHAGIAVDQDITSAEEMARHGYYQDFLGHFGLRWWAGFGFGVGDDVWCLALHRSVRQGPFEADEQAPLLAIHGRIAQTVAISSAVGHASLLGAVNALDLVAQPALALGHNGQVRLENAAARDIYDRDFHVAAGRIVVRDRVAASALAALQERCRLFGNSFDNLPAIIVQRQNRRPILIRAHGLSAETARPFASGRALLLIDDLERRQRTEPQQLAAVFGLTPGEARLAVLIGAGLSLDHSCEQLGLTKETGRSVLKSIFAKMGVNRQGEVVELIGRLHRARQGRAGSP